MSYLSNELKFEVVESVTYYSRFCCNCGATSYSLCPDSQLVCARCKSEKIIAMRSGGAIEHRNPYGGIV